MLKFFPARPSGGLDYLKAIAAPYQHLGISFLPLSGINASNMSSYLEDSLVAAIGGSWLAPREAIREGRWDHITSLAKTAIETIKNLRSK
jgi:2-dehydro-3-deoxyphosphogluconate aldolase/(4S)-4-hydroxy-2-oxoglutarate aldolase